MNLDRSLVKKQARSIIKGKTFILFLITIAVAILANGDTLTDLVHTIIKFPEDSSSVYDYFKDFDGSGEDSFFSDNGGIDKDYFKNFSGKVGLTAAAVMNAFDFDDFVNILGIFSFFMLPLLVTLMGYYLLVVRGCKVDLPSGFKYVFTNTFNSSYWRKLAFMIVYSFLLVILLLLFIVPGMIFYYKYYFAALIMAERPYLNVFDAMRISKKLTQDHKNELFHLDLSFLGWAFLGVITCGLGLIYVLPYIKTTQALYYENFKIRAISEGRILQDDFLSEQQRLAFYRTAYNSNGNSQNQNQNENAAADYGVHDAQQENETAFGSGMDTDYYNHNF